MGAKTPIDSECISQEVKDLKIAAEKQSWHILYPQILVHNKIPRNYWAHIASTILDLMRIVEFPFTQVEIKPLSMIDGLGSISICYFSHYGSFERDHLILKDSIEISDALSVSDQEIVCRANAIVQPHGLKAEIFPGKISVGVGGDERTHTSVMNLSGPFPGHDVLAGLATKICNTLPINRVTYELSRKTEECNYGPADKA